MSATTHSTISSASSVRAVVELQSSLNSMETGTLVLPKYASIDGNVSDSADAYNSIGLVAALVFGFASTNFYNAVENKSSAINLTFEILMAFVCVLSCYGMLVMTLQFYQLKRLQTTNPNQPASFLSATFIYRHTARAATWCSLLLFLVAMGVYGFLNNSNASALVLAAIFGFGAIASFAVWRRLADTFTAHCKKK